MKKRDINTEVLETIKKYLDRIGISTEQISTLMDSEEVSVSELAQVNIIKENRTGGSSNQTHIHITGHSMNNFFSQDVLNTVSESTDDEVIEIKMFLNNLIDLERKSKNTDSTAYIYNDGPIEDKYVYMKTVKKIAYRASSDSKQVQISKNAYDSKDFKKLREYLYENYWLSFFRLDDSYKKYTVVAIPKTSIANDVKIPKHQVQIPLRTKGFSLKVVNSEEIAKYNSLEKETQFNKEKMLMGINQRKTSTEIHQKLVTNLALFLENTLKFSILSGNIDCLAVDKNDGTAYIFEAKSIHDDNETEQVRKAFAQLFYYEEFAMKDYANSTSHKIALFNKKISNDHIIFFEKNNCHVVWVDEDNNFDFDKNDAILKEVFGPF